MIRLSLGRTALAATLVWVLAHAAHARDPKPTDPKPTDPKSADQKPADSKPSYVSPQTQKINELILKGYESAGIKRPAARASDDEYLRRVFIDLIGRIATPEEVLDFERDTSPDKRVKLVQRLLTATDYQPRSKTTGQLIPTGKGSDGKPTYLTFRYTEQWADHWAELWTVWLMTRSGNQDYRDQMRVWLDKQFAANISHKDLVTKLLTATGQVGGAKTGDGWPYKDDYAANFIIHHLGEAVKDPKERARDGAFDGVPITSRVTRLFLGLQTQCTQCHDHPFNKEWVQTDFWGVNAFFRQTVRSATPSGPPVGNNPKMANAALVTLTDDPSLNSEMLVFYERRDGRRLGSFPIMLKDYAQAQNGEKSSKTLASAGPGKTRRQQLAEWVVTHDNFSKAYVNRLWAHFFGRGMNKEPSADDFGSNNDIVHPELLAYLGEEFAKYNYEPKRLMEWICTSDVYQLSHVAVKEYADIKYEPYFARMALKAMSPEVLYESLKTATRADRRKSEGSMQRRDAWMRKLVRQFGDDEGNELNFNGTVVQALLMMNGTELNGELGVGRNGDQATLITDLLKKTGSNPAKMYDELFLMTLNRHPTGAEISKLEDVRNGKATVTVGPATPPKGPNPKGPNPKAPAIFAPGAGPGDIGFCQDVFWALLNTNEFMLNH
ncbi:MAG: hypothetical protein JWO38_5088 [Gemmataceae bacterium]|nr:hypothetical protein [Gemmataceae bacterium]